MYLCKTAGPYFVNITSSKRQLKYIFIDPEDNLPQYNRKYRIFSTLLSFIQRDGGIISTTIRFQLASDCQSQDDLSEFFYHIFKMSPPDAEVVTFLNAYSCEFQDVYFEDLKAQVVSRLNKVEPDISLSTITHKKTRDIQEKINTINTRYEGISSPITTCGSYPIKYVVGSTQKMDKFYLSNDGSLNISTNKPLAVLNSVSQSYTLKTLREYVRTCFVVNKTPTTKRNQVHFILKPGLKALAVTVYNNTYILNKHS
nr:hypothetical protein MmNV_25 [Menippe mercenaria nudivirus]